MAVRKKEKIENQADNEENPDFIRKFIEQKKLQNKVLGEIIDKISTKIDSNNISKKSKPINKNKKP
jgi:hypothetical protein